MASFDHCVQHHAPPESHSGWPPLPSQDALCSLASRGDACVGLGEFLGFVALQCCGLPTWPTVKLLCKSSHAYLRTPWLFARNQPRDGIMLRNDRCASCGWWSGRICVKFEALDTCVLCDNTGVCENCLYVSTLDQRVYCMECEVQPGAPLYKTYFDQVRDMVYDRCDAMCLAGPCCAPRQHAIILQSAGCCVLHGTVADVFRGWRKAVVDWNSCVCEGKRIC